MEPAATPMRLVRRGRFLVAEPDAELEPLTVEEVRQALDQVRRRPDTSVLVAAFATSLLRVGTTWFGSSGETALALTGLGSSIERRSGDATSASVGMPRRALRVEPSAPGM